MQTYECDIVIVGAGPAGSVAAKYAAEGGLDVVLLEKRAEIGAPLRCAEGISKKWLSEIGMEPDPKWISAEMDGAIIVSPSGHTFKLDESQAGNEVGYVLERHLFDKALAEQASKAGAKIWLRTAATGVIKEDGLVTGVYANRMGEKIAIRADCVVGADGFESQVGRWAGIDTTLDLTDMCSCLQYRMVNIDVEPNYCEFVLGSAAPGGGYVWIFPKGKGIANVGIGVQGSKCKSGADAKYYLDKFINEDPRLNKGAVLEIVGGAVSTCPGLEETVTDNVVLVGDAARLIDPITGGGICHAARSGMYAGKVLTECAKKGDFSKEALSTYEKMWRDKMEDKLWRNWMAKEKFAALSDEVLDDLVLAIKESDISEVNVYNLLKVIKEKYPDLVAEFEDMI
ncbi:MAG TPA: NAD(P)/FAD-dependent oxidoreductase [Candidatus Methanomethylophilaceae archaeon]|nr:NAD(P)/FAD-dependent oxidoreductase [Candidatus Methanomethylophilaceae archaeon]